MISTIICWEFASIRAWNLGSSLMPRDIVAPGSTACVPRTLARLLAACLFVCCLFLCQKVVRDDSIIGAAAPPRCPTRGPDCDLTVRIASPSFLPSFCLFVCLSHFVWPSASGMAACYTVSCAEAYAAELCMFVRLGRSLPAAACNT
jgi:hypothetical protein